MIRFPQGGSEEEVLGGELPGGPGRTKSPVWMGFISSENELCSMTDTPSF